MAAGRSSWLAAPVSTLSISCTMCICRKITRTSTSLWVDFPNKYFDPEKGLCAIPTLSLRIGVGRQTRLRRHRRQRAPQHRLQHDAGAEPDRRRDHSADQERQDLRLGHAAKSRISEPPGGRIRHAGRALAGPAGSRVSARHRHGILGQPDQPGDARGRAIASRSTSFCRPGRRTAQPNITATSTPIVISIHGRGRIRSRIRPATSSAPAARRPSISPPSSASATRRCSSPSSARLSSIRNCAGLRPNTATTSGPSSLPVQVITYVAETKEKAEEEAIEHIRFFFEDALRTTPTFLAPPGYLSVDRAEEARGACRQAARRPSASRPSTSRSSSRSAPPIRWSSNSKNGASGWGPTISTFSAPSATCRTGRW